MIWRRRGSSDDCTSTVARLSAPAAAGVQVSEPTPFWLTVFAEPSSSGLTSAKLPKFMRASSMSFTTTMRFSSFCEETMPMVGS